jgi:hypothetical protein
MPELWIDDATAAEMKDLESSFFLMDKQLGRTVDLVLRRDGANQTAQKVLVVLEPVARDDRSQAARLVEARGEFQKEPPFNVQVEDRFTLMPENMPGHITAVLQDSEAFIRAAFVLEQ